jgi:predicted transcriptional regulator
MIAEGITAIAAGGATGIVGTAVSSYFQDKKDKKVLEHKEKMMQIEKEMLQLEVEKAGKTKVSLESENDNLIIPHLETFDPSTNENKVINFIRNSVRPVTTYILMIFTLYIIFKLSNSVNNITPEDNKTLLEMYDYSINSLLYVFSSITLYWFGTRNLNKGAK